MPRFIYTLLLLILPSFLFAATKITGVVTDAQGKPVPGANVFIKDTYDGATTDANGNFSFTTDETGEKIFSASFLGFENSDQKILLDGQDKKLNISLREKINELNTVTISAGAFEASDERKMVILKPLDIVTTAGANGDVYGALQTLPGTQQIGEKEGLYVRGGDATETKTIIDGIMVDNPYFTSVPDVPQRGRFSPFLFKGTSFSTGGYSAQYGQALSSALILESQDLVEQSGTNLGIMSVGLSGGHTVAKKNSSIGVFGGYTNLKPYMAVFDQDREWIHEPEAVSGSVVYRLKTSQTGLLKTFVNYGYNNLSLKYTDINHITEEDSYTFSLKNNNLFANASYKEIIAKNWNLFTAFSYSDNKDNIHYNSFPIGNHNTLMQGRTTLSRGIGRLSILRFGGEYQHPESKETYYNTRLFSENYAAGYVEGDIYLTPKIVARAGARYEHSGVLNRSNLAPRVSLAYKTGKYAQVSFAYGDFYQAADKDFLFLNPKLNFEKATHYILNYQVVSEKRTFRVETYYKNYGQLVKSIPVSVASGVDSIYNNSGDGYARGFDIFWRDKQTLRCVDYWISYSYLDTKRNYRSFPVTATPSFAATHTLSIVYKHFIPKWNLQAGFTYAMNSGRPYYNPNKPSSEYLTDYTKPYHNLSINGSYLTSIRKNFTVIVFSVTNVLGINNVFSYNYSLDGARREEVIAPAPRFVFVGMFINIGSQKDDSDKYN